MGSVGTPVVRRMIDVVAGSDDGHRSELLARVGLTPAAEGVGWSGESIDESVYYDLIEHLVAADDAGFPFRYARAVHPDDLGALGLAVKTAATVEDALERLLRYILVLSDTLEYEFLTRGAPHADGRIFALIGRPHHRRGAALANECALAAVVSLVRSTAGRHLRPVEVTFCHPHPGSDHEHREFFGCPVRFEAAVDGVRFRSEDLAVRTLLADDGLSTFLLQRLDDLRAQAAQRTIVDEVRAAVADSLADGQPSRSRIARRLAMSERTLHRRLADVDETFQAIATGVRREAAEALLASSEHSLVEIAFLTGFSDQTAFTRAFKRWTGHTPAGFRGEQRGGAR